MDSALALAPLTLAAVLVLSGLAKLPDPDATHSMMRMLRLPQGLARREVARALPWAELGIAVLLLSPWLVSFGLGAVAAFLLFLAFWVVIARAMTFRPRPSCGCFGQVGDHRVTWRTVVRNTLLLALAVLACGLALLGRTGTGLLGDFTRSDWTWLLLSVAMAAIAVLILGAGVTLPRPSRTATAPATSEGGDSDAGQPGQHGATGPRWEIDELDYVRRPIPRGVLLDRSGGVTELQALARARAQLLVLVNCWCGPTHEALERLPRWQAALPQLDVQMIFGPRPFEHDAVPPELGGVWWDPGLRVYEALEVGPSPGAVLLGADGLLAGGPVHGISDIEEFVSDIAAQLAEA